MKFLILSISFEGSGNRQRSHYLREALHAVGHETVIIDWQKWNAREITTSRAGAVHQIKLLPTRTYNVVRIPFWNQLLVHRRLKQIVNGENIDAVIWPNNWYLIGYPPRDLGVPIIVDYFDLLTEEMERRYFENDQIVLCASLEMTKRASRFTSRAHWIPTPIEMERFAISRTEAKARLGIDKHTRIISLIGLTASTTMYFIDAVDTLEDNNLRCLLVGEGELRPLIEDRLVGVRNPERFSVVGKVPYDEVNLFFCATDVGLYPGEDIEYYHVACPIKILEYSVAGAAVVCNSLREVANWQLSNVILAEPNTQSFAVAIESALNSDRPKPDLSRFSLQHVSRELEHIISVNL